MQRFAHCLAPKTSRRTVSVFGVPGGLGVRCRRRISAASSSRRMAARAAFGTLNDSSRNDGPNAYSQSSARKLVLSWNEPGLDVLPSRRRDRTGSAHTVDPRRRCVAHAARNVSSSPLNASDAVDAGVGFPPSSARRLSLIVPSRLAARTGRAAQSYSIRYLPACGDPTAHLPLSRLSSAGRSLSVVSLLPPPVFWDPQDDPGPVQHQPLSGSIRSRRYTTRSS
jgi:hypothetical protein